MASDPKTCKHYNFRIDGDIARLTEVEGGPIKSFSLELQVCCADCGMPFHFCGVPVIGSGGAEPRVSPDGLELRLPIMPKGKPLPKGIPGALITFGSEQTEH